MVEGPLGRGCVLESFVESGKQRADSFEDPVTVQLVENQRRKVDAGTHHAMQKL